MTFTVHQHAPNVFFASNKTHCKACYVISETGRWDKDTRKRLRDEIAKICMVFDCKFKFVA